MTWDAAYAAAEAAWLEPPSSSELCPCCDLPPDECERYERDPDDERDEYFARMEDAAW